MASNVAQLYTLLARADYGYAGIVKVSSRGQPKPPLRRFDPPVIPFRYDVQTDLEVGRIPKSLQMYHEAFVQIALALWKEDLHSWLRRLSDELPLTTDELQAAIRHLNPEFRKFVEENHGRTMYKRRDEHTIASSRLGWSEPMGVSGSSGVPTGSRPIPTVGEAMRETGVRRYNL